MQALSNEKVYKEKLLHKINYYFIIFLIASISGYIYEIFFYLFTENTLSNRGFLYGPYLPVYGVGALAMAILLKRFIKNPFLIFSLSIIITGIIEYVTGYLMFAIWKKTWWDYNGLFMNIQGYVCLRSVLTFAVGALVLFYIIFPLLDKLFKKVNQRVISIVSLTSAIIILADIILTFIFRNPIVIYK